MNHDFDLVRDGSRAPAGWHIEDGLAIGPCYQLAQRAALAGRGTYVEGVAEHELEGIVPHAWIERSDGTPVEVTWPRPGLRYLGVPVTPTPTHAGPALPGIVAGLRRRLEGNSGPN